MPKQLPKRSCPTCSGNRVKKNGTTKAGTTRYRCLDCGASHIAKRPSSSQTYTFEAFCRYVLGKSSLSELKRGSERSSRREFTWCWDVNVPVPVQSGQIYDQIFIDGTYLHGGWVLLIACTTSHVLNWVLCARESAASYETLLTPLAPPMMVVVDGAKGALHAIQQCWPETTIQRCLVHVQRNNFRDLTRKPKTAAGRVLLELSRALPRITNHEQANTWMSTLNNFYQAYADYLKERTYATTLPHDQRRPGRTWWYTHERDRRVYFRLKRLLKRGELFAYLHKQEPTHSTTNIVESHNAAIKLILRHHRGWSPRQQIQAAFHYLNTRSETPLSPRQILTQWRQAGHPTYQLIPPTPPRTPQAPKHFNQHAPWEDGLTIRKS